MNSENVIEVKNVNKSFKIYFDKGHQLKEKILFRERNRHEVKKVLDDISFSVKRGEAIGLIGHNGCGKSTTLKLLTRIMYPDSGTIEMKGRVSSLLELGAGFHPDMSGRENIYINASIFGLSRKEIDRRLEDIIAFSELEKYIDNPVRTYSSGMYARLAFSVAINVDADILLVDEILSVGDVNFQKKCFDKMLEIKRQGTTIIIVSHAQGPIEQICDRAIWIHEGRIASDGNPHEAYKKYLNFMGEQRNEIIEKEKNRFEEKKQVVVSENTIRSEKLGNCEIDLVKHSGSGEARIINVSVMDKQNVLRHVYDPGDEIRIKVRYVAKSVLKRCIFGISIYRNDGLLCYGTNTGADGFSAINIEGEGEFTFSFKKLQLLNGIYYVAVCIADEKEVIIDYINEVGKFEVNSSDRDIGVIRVDHVWNYGGKCYEYNV